MLPFLQDNLWPLEYEFPFLVPLWWLVGPLVLPTQQLLAIGAVDISHGVEARNEVPIFFRPNSNVHCMRKQKTSAISSLGIISNTGTSESWQWITHQEQGWCSIKKWKRPRVLELMICSKTSDYGHISCKPTQSEGFHVRDLTSFHYISNEGKSKMLTSKDPVCGDEGLKDAVPVVH